MELCYPLFSSINRHVLYVINIFKRGRKKEVKKGLNVSFCSRYRRIHIDGHKNDAHFNRHSVSKRLLEFQSTDSTPGACLVHTYCGLLFRWFINMEMWRYLFPARLSCASFLGVHTRNSKIDWMWHTIRKREVKKYNKKAFQLDPTTNAWSITSRRELKANRL